jgi:hypothetical protein
MGIKEFLAKNWKYIAVFALLIIIVPEFIRFTGNSFNNSEESASKFTSESFMTPGPSFWLQIIMDFSLIVISSGAVIYLLKKQLIPEDIAKIILAVAVVFSATNLIYSAITYSQVPGMDIFGIFSYDFIGGLAFLFTKSIHELPISLAFILIPSFAVLGINRLRKI